VLGDDAICSSASTTSAPRVIGKARRSLNRLAQPPSPTPRPSGIGALPRIIAGGTRAQGAARARRQVLADWNGLLIAALAARAELRKPRLVALAARAFHLHRRAMSRPTAGCTTAGAGRARRHPASVTITQSLPRRLALYEHLGQRLSARARDWVAVLAGITGRAKAPISLPRRHAGSDRPGQGPRTTRPCLGNGTMVGY